MMCAANESWCTADFVRCICVLAVASSILSADESSMMLLKRECWHAAPQWVSVSSFKDGVDGAALDEHRQPFLAKRAPA